MPGGGDVQVAGPGIFRGRATLHEQVRPLGVGAADPTVNTTVPQPQPVRLALGNGLPRLTPRLIQNVEQLIHTKRIAFQHFSTPPSGRLSASQLFTGASHLDCASRGAFSPHSPACAT